MDATFLDSVYQLVFFLALKAGFLVLASKLLDVIVLRHSRNFIGMLTVVEPIPEAVEAILHKIFRCSEVKPWINCSYISPCLTLCVGKARGRKGKSKDTNIRE